MEAQQSSLITVRDLDTGRCVGFFRTYESVLKCVALMELRNWAAERRHPTLNEMSEVFSSERTRGVRV